MSEHDDLDGQIGHVGPLAAEHLNRPEEGEVEKREGHGPFSPSLALWRKSQLNVPDEVLGTHRIDLVLRFGCGCRRCRGSQCSDYDVGDFVDLVWTDVRVSVKDPVARDRPRLSTLRTAMEPLGPCLLVRNGQLFVHPLPDAAQSVEVIDGAD